MIGEGDRWSLGPRRLRQSGPPDWRVALLGALSVALGCGVNDDPASRIAAANDSNVRRLGNLYQAYRLRNSFQGPKDQAEFVAFLKQGMAPERLERMGVDPDDIEGLFISDRDGKPLVIRYGVDGGLGAVDAVVFEAEGRTGKRQVGFTDGSVQEVDDVRYQQLLEGNTPRAEGAL